MDPSTLNTLKEKLYTRLTHHRYLLGVCGLNYTKYPSKKLDYPIQVDTVHEAKVTTFFTNRVGQCINYNSNPEKPRYIIMMPVVLPESYAKLNALVHKFFSEACESEDERKRTTLIIGINARRGLDSRKMEEVRTFSNEWEKAPFSCLITGFVWDSQYTYKAGWKYDAYKTFRIFSLIDPVRAAEIKREFDQTKVDIPYVNIRERILKDDITEKVYLKVRRSITYLGIADPDADNFNRVIKGADTELKKFKDSKGDFPDLFCPGYEASSKEPEVIQAGLKVDRMIRSETCNIIGMGAYFSETFVLFKVANSVKDFSFITPETKKNQKLESRRLFQNGVALKLIDPNKILHGGLNPIITFVMDRMRTRYTEKYLDMSEENLYSLEALKCMCGLTYNHLSPREWALNLYTALPKTDAHNTQDILIPMQEIYKVVHPIYTATKHLGECFSSDDFSEWLIRFDSYLEAINSSIEDSDIDYPLALFDETQAHYAAFKKFINYQIFDLNQAWQKLADAGLDNDWINKIYLAAFYSGSKTSIYLKRGRKLIKS